MRSLDSDNETLPKNHFVWLPKRRLWISLEQRKAFSDPVASDSDSRSLTKCLQEAVPKGCFYFYLVPAPAEFLEEDAAGILKEIGLSGLKPAASGRA